MAVDESLAVAPVEPTRLRDLQSDLQHLETAYRQLAAVIAGSDREGLARLKAELDELNVTVERRRGRVEELSQAETRAKALQTATTSAPVNVTSRRFEALEPLARNIFSRLDAHPTFKELVFEHEIYRAKGTTSARVFDPVEQLAADPLLVFSAAQANITALAYCLALGWAAGERALPFVLLDDPLQSMDDVNVLGFADLCRMIRRDRQLVIATHEDRFAGPLERKLAPRLAGERTIIHEFQAWERQGCIVKTRHVASQPLEATNLVLRAG